uniref:Complement C5 n=1 Tax=Sus scrofa TaxID=9823 RepID=A0A4X1UM89_PIG
MLQKKIEEEAAKYKYAMLKKCCYDGAYRNDDETCEERAARIKIGPKCVKAFKDCCYIANQVRAEESHKNIQLGRLRKSDIFYQNTRGIGCNFSCSI